MNYALQLRCAGADHCPTTVGCETDRLQAGPATADAIGYRYEENRGMDTVKVGGNTVEQEIRKYERSLVERSTFAVYKHFSRLAIPYDVP